MNTSLIPTRPLGDVAKVISGYAFKSAEFGEKGVPVIKIKNIRVGTVDLGDAAYVDERFLELDSKYHVNPGDLLISLTGSHPNQPNSVVGRVARMGNHQSRCLLNQRAGKIYFRKGADGDLGYLFYVLSSPKFRNAVAMLANGAASQANVSPTQVEGLEIPLPDLPTQRKIAGILSAYDDLIENNLCRIKILEQMAQSLYREWFVHFRFPGHESATFKDSELGRIPEGWEVKKLGELADQMRRSVSKGQLDEVTRYVGLEHIPRQLLALDAWEEVAELGSNKLQFERGEVLFGKIRPYFHKVSIAPFEGICSADTIVIRAKEPELRALVISCVFSEAFVAHASATANGAKMPRADWKVLKEYPLVLPPATLLEKFSAVFEDADLLARNLVGRNETLRQTRDLLLPKLLEGNT